LGGDLRQLRLLLRGEMYFHALKVRENRKRGNTEPESARKSALADTGETVDFDETPVIGTGDRQENRSRRIHRGEGK
jgi:hypothetical protein